MAMLQTLGQRATVSVRLLRSGLNRRLLAWFLLFSLVPLLVTNAVGYQRTEAIIERLVENDLSSIARVQAQHVRDRADHLTLLLDAITAGNDLLAAGAMRVDGEDVGRMANMATPAAVKRQLAEKLLQLTTFDAIYLYTAHGRLVAAVGNPARIEGLVAPESLSEFSAGRRRTSRGIEPEFRLAVPVMGNHGRPVAWLGATIAPDTREFPQIPERMAGSVSTFILDEYGRPLWMSRTRPSTDYTVPLSTPLIGMPVGAYAHYNDRDRVPVLGTMALVPGYPWRFVVEMPEADAFGELRELRDLSLVLEMVFVLLLISTAWTVARDIVAPLRRLVDATRRVGRGDLSVRVLTRERDEIGALGESFNEMTTALAQTTARVKELHQREIERASQLATVGELASGIAHEIKNPVVGVASGLDLVKRRLGPATPLAPILDEMTRQLARIQVALQELLTFARPATPTFAPVSGNHVIERAVRLVQARAEHQGVRLIVECDPHLPQLLADEEMLHQSLVNLLMNALDATDAGGSIRISTRASGDFFELEIADTGRGIAAADLDHVFKPFFTTRHKGTGLGLSITREIIQRHGGQVTLDSVDGVGTTVTMRLPFHPASAEQPARLQETVPA